MTNVFFPEEQISTDDLYFVCYMIERVARQLKQPNKYVANMMGHDELAKKLSLADTLHSENPLAVVAAWTDEYQLQMGNYDITKVDAELCPNIPTATQMGKVYKRLILIRSNLKKTMQTLSFVSTIIPFARLSTITIPAPTTNLHPTSPVAISLVGSK